MRNGVKFFLKDHQLLHDSRNHRCTLEFWHLLKMACWFSDGIRTSSTWNPPKSQILTAPSSEPEAKRSPSGDKAKDLMLDLCPVNRCKTSPDRTSHTLKGSYILRRPQNFNEIFTLLLTTVQEDFSTILIRDLLTFSKGSFISEDVLVLVRSQIFANSLLSSFPSTYIWA